jgi:hypothetical protein
MIVIIPAYMPSYPRSSNGSSFSWSPINFSSVTKAAAPNTYDTYTITKPMIISDFEYVCVSVSFVVR